MRRKVQPLLCELHAHTAWSDGALSVPQLVDLYGRSGFDVLCVTDHVNRTDDPWLPAGASPRGVTAERHDAYLAELAREAERARADYDLLLVPGLELSYNDLDAGLAAHAVAVGCQTFVGVDDGIDAALAQARAAGAALIAAHPFRSRRAGTPGRLTMRFARDWRRYATLVDRWELFNRYDLFAWIAARGLPAVANGDFHRPEHLFGWKSLLPCAKNERAPWSTTWPRRGRPSSRAWTSRSRCRTLRSDAPARSGTKERRHRNVLGGLTATLGLLTVGMGRRLVTIR